jgi:hypothetical protein
MCAMYSMNTSYEMIKKIDNKKHFKWEECIGCEWDAIECVVYERWKKISVTLRTVEIKFSPSAPSVNSISCSRADSNDNNNGVIEFSTACIVWR